MRVVITKLGRMDTIEESCTSQSNSFRLVDAQGKKNFYCTFLPKFYFPNFFLLSRFPRPYFLCCCVVVVFTLYLVG